MKGVKERRRDKLCNQKRGSINNAQTQTTVRGFPEVREGEVEEGKGG